MQEWLSSFRRQQSIVVTYSPSSEICGDRIFLSFTVADVVVLNLVMHIFNVNNNFPLW